MLAPEKVVVYWFCGVLFDLVPANICPAVKVFDEFLRAIVLGTCASRLVTKVSDAVRPAYVE